MKRTTAVLALLTIWLGGCSSKATLKAGGTGGSGGQGGAVNGDGSPGSGGATSSGGTSADLGGSGGDSTSSPGGATSWATGSGGATSSGGLNGHGGTSGVTGRPDASPPRDGVLDAAPNDAAMGTGGALVGRGGSSGAGGLTSLGGSSATDGTLGGGGATATGGSGGDGGSTRIATFPDKFVGNIDTLGKVRSDFATHWDQFSPENAGKWASVEGSRGAFRWDTLDTMYKYCEEHDIVFKEHCFIWGAGEPAWMAHLDTTTGPEAVQNWMRSFCERYPNTRLIDVVNEPPPHTTPTYVNAIGGGTNTTWEWIANSFKWARDACPNAILLLNDYNNLEYSTDVQHTIDIVLAIKQLGAPIDAVGCQTHDAAKLPSSTLQANLEKIVAATGLPVYITEYDIGLADDAQQKQQYEDHITMFWNNPNVKGITLWGYIFGSTWRSNTGIMMSDGTMRPAMAWLMDFLGR